MEMFIKLRPRKIFIFLVLIPFVDYAVLSQGEIHRRKTQSDNYIKLTYGGKISYDENNPYNRGNRDMVSYIKTLSGNTIQKEILNQQSELIIEGVEMEVHFSNCVSSLENFFGCDYKDTNYYDENSLTLFDVDFSNFDSSCLESTEKLFYECSNLISLDFSGFSQIKSKICLICFMDVVFLNHLIYQILIYLM